MTTMPENHMTMGETIRKKLNDRMKALFHIDDDGHAKPYVCFICDRFCSNEWSFVQTTSIKNISYYLESKDAKLSETLRECYEYKGNGSEDWMKSCLLSTRGIYLKKNGRNGFVVCKDCKYAVSFRKLPFRAIANGFYFGTPPSQLTDLWDSELAILTPTSCYGFCFTYVGGFNRKLKGTLGFYKVRPESIARRAVVANVISKFLNREVVFLLHGKMTDKQRKKAKERSRIRPQKVLEAIVWCIENHDEWKNIDVTKIQENIENCHPILIDNSETVESGDDEVTEDKESFSVYLPDGTMNEVYGGRNSGSDFRKVVAEAANNGFDGEIVTSLTRDFVKDYTGNAFVSSCILQMPFGRGSCHEKRYNTSGEVGNKWSLNEYAEHLSYISQPSFQNQIFVLKLFNIKIRSTILRSASQQLYSKFSTHNIRERINATDFQTAANAYGNGRRAGSAASQQLVKSIQATNKALPHSNGAVNRARMFMEVLQQQFGLGGIFLTVTPDDENSFLVVAYSQTDNNGKPFDIETLSTEMLKENARKRAECRVSYPGITALNFEYVLDIVLEVVIGWDVKTNAPTKTPGLFGVPKAFGGAVEEQGRTSLHVHFIIWLHGWDTYLKNITHSREHIRRTSQDVITKVVDNATTTNLFNFINDQSRNVTYQTNKVFDHDCTEPFLRKRKRPEIVDEQQLRNLRHKDCSQHDLSLARCPDCDRSWTNEDLVLNYLTRVNKLPISHFPDKTNTLDQICYEYTKPLHDGNIEKAYVQARYNSHRSTHCKSCFNHKKLFPDECRMRLPAVPKKKTVVQKLPLTENGDNIMPWYRWNGECVQKEIMQVVPKRDEYDVFQNSCCWPISESKIGGNTNVSVITPGPVGLYTVKYPTKNTQEDDTEPYQNSIDAYAKALDKDRVHESDRSESLRLVVLCGFAHNKTNVVGCSMASYLTRRHTRFIFSHQFAWIPLLDFLNIFQKDEISRTTIKSHQGHRFAEVTALNYLCRPRKLKHLNPYDFFCNYETIKLDSKNRRKKDILSFESNQYYSHPSHIELPSGDIKELFGIRERHTKQVPWFKQSAFPDTATFRTNILQCNDQEICQEMEEYASLVLCLCSNFYCHDDIKLSGSYVKKLRDLYYQGKLACYEQFLQYLQDSRGNYGRVSSIHDELQSTTRPFKKPGSCEDEDDDEDLMNDVDENGMLQGYDLDEFLVELDTETVEYNDRRGTLDSRYVPLTIDTSILRQKGDNNCGYDKLCTLTRESMTDDNIGGDFVNCNNADIHVGLSEDETVPIIEKAVPDRSQLLEILFTKNGTTLKSFCFGSDIVEKELPEANGSVKSIINWGKKAGFDNNQQRAFEIFASSFVLTFYNQADQIIQSNNETEYSTDNTSFLEARLQLLKLSARLPTNATCVTNNVEKNNLICFLHGHGGSGKSAIIDILLLYAHDFCDFIKEKFTEYTIVVTAMSGVAATLIHGKTTHGALYLNSKATSIKSEEKERWKCTRLVIIDEISFASRSLIEKMERHLQVLKDNMHLRYGGVDVLFCGDLRQLEPPNKDGKTLYSEPFYQFHTYVNCYIELDGLHRFKDDIEWGLLLRRFRNGKLTEDDVDTINERVVYDESELPLDIRYATYTNKDRSSINVGLFQEYCQENGSGDGDNPMDDVVVIFASDIKVRDGSKTYVRKDDAWLTWFFEQCSEGDCSTSGFSGRFDPALMLYYNRPVMVNKNVDVSSEIANGTRAFLSQVHLHYGEVPSFIDVGGVRVKAVRTCQVQCITLRRETKDGEPRSFFDVTSLKHSFSAKVTIPDSLLMTGRRGGNKFEYLKMQGTQFPIICNNATTGHKLQGASVKNLFVHCWASVRNWVYVVLSRVTRRDGLYLRTKMKKGDIEKFNSIPTGLQDLINDFKNRILKIPLTDVEYYDILGDDVDS